MNKSDVAVAMAPSIGPAIVTLLGVEVPTLAMGLSLLTLILARQIAKPPSRKLTRVQEAALTILLVIILFLVVTGQLFVSKPLGPGWAVVWAIGLGLSGILILELIADNVLAIVRRFVEAWKSTGGGGSPPIA